MSANKSPDLLSVLHDYGINVRTRDIYLHSMTNEGEELGVEVGMASRFIKNLHFLDTPISGSYKPILVHFQSVGGCWDNGMAIFNAIKCAGSDIRILAYSQASSMSGVVFQAADVRIMMPDCHFLMHHGSAGINSGHPFGAKTEADFLMKACKRMLDVFAEKAVEGPYFKKKKSSTVQTAYNFFDKKIKEKVDWYMTAEEAVFYGLADDILGSKEYPDIDCLRKEWE